MLDRLQNFIQKPISEKIDILNSINIELTFVARSIYSDHKYDFDHMLLCVNYINRNSGYINYILHGSEFGEEELFVKMMFEVVNFIRGEQKNLLLERILSPNPMIDE